MSNVSSDWANSTTELDFEKHWSSQNIQEEVLRGVALREQKPKTDDIEYDFINIFLPSCSKSPAGASPRKHRPRKKKKKTRLQPTHKAQHCPLRVVELAEPTKRHCLNTWKNNYKTLPDYMVERLRRHVMDESPVVRISEAVNYFKNRKRLSKKSSTNHSKPRAKKIRDLNIILCSLFTYKIAQKLITPVNIILNKELANINHVVIGELNRILLNKKNNNSNTYKNDKILNEMAKKVTIWIANILEESSYKEFLEQLEEMEEEEGPVLDILDELLETVTIICKPVDSVVSVHSQDSNSISESLSTKKTEDGTESAYEDISDNTSNFKRSDNGMQLNKDKVPFESNQKNNGDEIFAMNENLETKEHVKEILQERINYIVDNIKSIKKENNTIVHPDESTDLFSNANIDNIATDLKQTTDDNNNLASGINNHYKDIENAIITEADKTLDITLNKALSSPEETIQEPNDLKLHSDAVVLDGKNNVSVEDPEEETKKVKFSNIDLGNRENQSPINRRSTELTHDSKEPVAWKSSKEYILSYFNVAPPNPNLLSYIDEVWPEYSLPPLLKATESVNKSVTSLGRITEIDDENIIQSPDQKITMENIQNVIPKDLNTAILNLKDEGVRGKKNENKDVAKRDDNIFKNTDFVKDLHGDAQSSLNTGFVKDMHRDIQSSVNNSDSVKDSHGDVQSSVKNMDFVEDSHVDVQSSMKNTDFVKDSHGNIHPSVNNTDFIKDSNGNIQSSVKNTNFVKKSNADVQPLSTNFPTNESIKIHTSKDLDIIKSNVSRKDVIKKLERAHNPQSSYDKFAIKDAKKPEIFPSHETVHLRKKQTLQEGGDVKSIKSKLSIQLGLDHKALMKDSTKKTPRDSFKAPVNTYITVNRTVQTSFVTNTNNDKYNFEKNENIMKWCMGLQNVTENLELWTTWIQNVCSIIAYLRHEGKSFDTSICKSKYRRKWIELKDNIDVDVLQWSQLRRRLCRGLRTHRKSYVMTRKEKSVPANKNRCKCSQKNSLCTQILFENYYRTSRV